MACKQQCCPLTVQQKAAYIPCQGDNPCRTNTAGNRAAGAGLFNIPLAVEGIRAHSQAGSSIACLDTSCKPDAETHSPEMQLEEGWKQQGVSGGLEASEYQQGNKEGAGEILIDAEV